MDGWIAPILLGNLAITLPVRRGRAFIRVLPPKLLLTTNEATPEYKLDSFLNKAALLSARIC